MHNFGPMLTKHAGNFFFMTYKKVNQHETKINVNFLFFEVSVARRTDLSVQIRIFDTIRN